MEEIKVKQGQLIAVNGAIYEYGEIESGLYTKNLKLHKVYDVEIDEDGILTATYNSWYFTDEELTEGIDKIQLTAKQWRGVVEFFLRQDYDLAEDEVVKATEDIVSRCFAYGIPKFHELENYIADYLKR